MKYTGWLETDALLSGGPSLLLRLKRRILLELRDLRVFRGDCGGSRATQQS